MSFSLFLSRHSLSPYELKFKIVKVLNVWIARKPPGFGFVEMEDPRDARDSVRELDGTKICGAR